MFNYFELNNPTDFQYLLNSAGEDITINGTPARAIVTNTNLNESSDNKKITTLEKIERGFLIGYDNNKWIVVSEVNGKRYSKYKGIMQKCNNYITVNSNGLYRVDCIVSNKSSLNVDTSTYITSLDNQIYVWVANTQFNNKIKVNDVYLLGNLNYKVIGIDDISNNGILIFKMEYSEIKQVFPLYTIQFVNEDNLTTDTVTPIQLNVIQKDGDVELIEPLPVVYLSSDESVATVDALGYVTPSSVGSYIITVSLQSDATVRDSISLSVEELPVVETYYLELTGNVQPDSEIKSANTKTYTCVKKNNLGVPVEGTTFNFAVNRGTSPTSAYTFTVLNETQCTIKCNSYLYYIDLVATDKSDNTLTISKTIKLRSIM